MWRRSSTLVIVALALHAQALIHSPPRITKQPPTDELLFKVANRVTENDTPFILECEAEGEPAPKYQWLKNGRKFDWQAYDDRMLRQPGRGTLVITSPRDEDSGQYQCFAENEHGTAASNSVFVRKAELNSFEDELPKALNAVLGEPFQLQCQSPDGWPKTEVFWWIQAADGGFKSINSSRITTDPEGNLWFSNVTDNDASNGFYYACAATSVFRNEFKLGNRVLLDVKQAPTQNRQPVRQYVTPENAVALSGKRFEMFCIYGGTPLPQIVWSKDGRHINWDYRIRQGNYGKSLIVQNVTFEDAGNYTCESSNGVGNAQTHSIELEVLVVLALSPEFTEPPRQQATVVGRNVSMLCRVFGVPKPEVKWLRNGLELTGSRYKVELNADLMITQVDFADAGDYACRAENKFGTKEANGSLIVKERTRITDAPQYYEVTVGNPVTIRCNAIADPSLDLQIKWLNDGEEIDFENEPHFALTNDYSLTIPKTVGLDSGIYTCVASTDLDEALAHRFLNVQDVPNPPRLKRVRCNAHDADVTWEPLGDNGSPILHYTIQYNTSFTPDSWQVAIDKVPATDWEYTVAMSPWANYTFATYWEYTVAMSPWANYTCRIVAFNKIGPSLPSTHSEQCTTQPDVPHKNPDNVEGKATESTNLLISWTPMPQIEHNGPQFRYRVFWKRDLPAEKWITEDISDWQQSNISIADQPASQRYRIKVLAFNELGESNVAAEEVIGYSGDDPSNLTKS